MRWRETPVAGSRIGQVGDDGFILIATGAVVGDGNHGHAGALFDFAGHSLGDQGRTAKGRADLDQERNLRMMLGQVVYFQQVVHGFAGILRAEVIVGQDFGRRVIVNRFGFLEDLFEIAPVSAFAYLEGGQDEF